MDERLSRIRRLIELGHFNYVCSTEVDPPMAERALSWAIAADAEDA